MPETPTPNMSLVLPTDHSDADVWGPILNDAIGGADGVDGHDHTTGKGVPVPVAGFDFNANLAASGHQITGLGAVDFTAVATSSVSALAGAFFVNSADSELYFRTIGGSNVKFTNGAALNVGAFTGGIGGDYSSAGALVDYVDASKLYRFRENDSGGRRWAGVQAGFVDLFEWNTLVTNRVRLQSPSALAASYVVTWPAATPTATGAVKMSPTGVLAVAAAVPKTIPAIQAYSPVPGTTAGSSPLILNSYLGWDVQNTNVAVAYPVSLDAGEPLSSVSVYASKNSNAAGSLIATLARVSSSGVSTTVASVTNSANAPGAIILTMSGLTEVVAADVSYLILVRGNAANVGDFLFHATADHIP